MGSGKVCIVSAPLVCEGARVAAVVASAAGPVRKRKRTRKDASARPPGQGGDRRGRLCGGPGRSRRALPHEWRHGPLRAGRQVGRAGGGVGRGARQRRHGRQVRRAMDKKGCWQIALLSGGPFPQTAASPYRCQARPGAGTAHRRQPEPRQAARRLPHGPRGAAVRPGAAVPVEMQ